MLVFFHGSVCFGRNPSKRKKKKKDLEALCCELKQRRDGIVERLYAATAPFQSRCQICDEDDGVTPVMNQRRWLRRRRWKMTTAARILICIAVCSKISKSRWLAAVCGSLCERERGGCEKWGWGLGLGLGLGFGKWSLLGETEKESIYI